MKKVIILLLVIAFWGCNIGAKKEEPTKFISTSIIGDWVNEISTDEKLSFLNNDSVVLMGGGDTLKLGFQIIKEVTPHQLYIFNEGKRIPFGIWKTTDKKLILRKSNVFERRVGFFSTGASRYEIPIDFNGILDVYVKK